MKFVLQLIAIAIIWSCNSIYLAAQCPDLQPNEDLEFFTQSDIDDFLIMYPNCTQLEYAFNYNLKIEGLDINNLTGFQNITTTNGIVFIENTSLLDLTGLENIDSVKSLRIDDNLNLTSLNGLQGLSSFTSSTGSQFLGLDNNENLTDISALSNLNFAGVSISLRNNNSLQNLNGLENLEMAPQNNSYPFILIVGNEILTDISALASLQSCITYFIAGNTMLAVCDYVSICNANNLDINFSTCNLPIGGQTSIMDNAPGCNSNEEVAAKCESICPEFTPFYDFNTQSEIDEFLIMYPNCTVIDANLRIEGLDITNLNGLQNVTHILGGFAVDNTSIVDLTGVENLEYVLSPSIEFNPNLISLNGLQGLESVEGSVNIEHNPSLTDISALSNLTNVGLHVNIFNNSSLQNLDGLQNMELVNIYGGSINFVIQNNDVLDDISAIASLQDCLNYNISDNPMLSVCNYLSVCNSTWFNDACSNSFTTIENNAPGCNSREEVLIQCDSITSVDEVTLQRPSIFPNPTLDQVTVELFNNKNASLTILDVQGTIITEKKFNTSTQITNTDLPSGIYIFAIQSASGIWYERVVFL